ncbi:hypothetical protein ACFL08_00945 [Patescibacteria group bacterium]
MIVNLPVLNDVKKFVDDKDKGGLNSGQEGRIRDIERKLGRGEMEAEEAIRLLGVELRTNGLYVSDRNVKDALTAMTRE